MSTSVKVAIPKDAFVVHSKSDKMHAALVNLLGATLASFGRSLWEYSDWDWNATRKGAFQYYWSGSANEFDPARHMTGEAPFRRRQKFTEVDNESLDELLQTSRVLILLSPTSGQLGDGSSLEVDRIAALTAQEESPEGHVTRPLIVAGGLTKNPLPAFAALASAFYLRLSNDNPRDAARLAAAFVSAWAVHTLQTTYGALAMIRSRGQIS